MFKLGSSGTGTPQTTYAPTSTPTLNQPDGLCLDSAGNVYVVDSGNQRVLMFNNAGVYQQVIANTANTNPPLNYPWNCAVDSSNNIYISNTAGVYEGIVKMTLNGASTPATQTGFFNSSIGGIPFAYPNQVALDSAGVLYVADPGNNRIIKMSNTGAVLTPVFQLVSGAPLPTVWLWTPLATCTPLTLITGAWLYSILRVPICTT